MSNLWFRGWKPRFQQAETTPKFAELRNKKEGVGKASFPMSNLWFRGWEPQLSIDETITKFAELKKGYGHNYDRDRT